MAAAEKLDMLLPFLEASPLLQEVKNAVARQEERQIVLVLVGESGSGKSHLGNRSTLSHGLCVVLAWAARIGISSKNRYKHTRLTTDSSETKHGSVPLSHLASMLLSSGPIHFKPNVSVRIFG